MAENKFLPPPALLTPAAPAFPEARHRAKRGAVDRNPAVRQSQSGRGARPPGRRRGYQPDLRCESDYHNASPIAAASRYRLALSILLRVAVLSGQCTGEGGRLPKAIRPTACWVIGSSDRRGRLISSQSPSSDTRAVRSSRIRPFSNGKGRRISTSAASRIAASGHRQRAAASAVSIIAEAGNIATSSTT